MEKKPCELCGGYGTHTRTCPFCVPEILKTPVFPDQDDGLMDTFTFSQVPCISDDY